MNTKWAQFDQGINAAEINADITALGNKNGDFDEVPHGKYEVKIDSMELRESKAGNPMLSVQFRILTGDFERQCLFMNQVAWMGDQNDKYRINGILKFINSLGTEVQVGVFKGLNDLDDKINEAFNSTEINGLEFLLKYDKNKGGYDTFTIEDVYEA